LALVVLVESKAAPGSLAPGEEIPAFIDGVLVDVQEIGEITIQ